MSLEDFINTIADNPLIITLIFIAIPLCSLLVSLLHRKGEGGASPWKYIYSLFVYLASIPGMFALVITFYSLIFLQKNLLTLDISVYFLPVISLVATLLIIKRSVRFDEIPGFGRILGLLILIAVSFVTAIFISKTRIWILFRGSLLSIAGLAVIIFLLFGMGIRMIKGRKRSDF